MIAFARPGCAAVVAPAVLLSPPLAARARQREKPASLECGDGCELRVSTNRLLGLRNDGPNMRLRFGGRLHLDDAAIFDEPAPMQNDWRIRRARPEFRARLFDVLKLEVDYELAPDRQGWRNVWARVTHARLAKKKRVRHVGGSFEWRGSRSGSVWRPRSWPESSIADAILGTVWLGDVDSTITGAREAAWIHGRVSVQGEAVTTRLHRNGCAPDGRLWGAYARVG